MRNTKFERFLEALITVVLGNQNEASSANKIFEYYEASHVVDQYSSALDTGSADC